MPVFVVNVICGGQLENQMVHLAITLKLKYSKTSRIKT